MSGEPIRLHHSAVVVKDLAVSRTFYENIMGLPLVATWCESSDGLGEFCHAFFRLVDGSCIALFQFAREDVYQKLNRPESLSGFHHVALLGTEEMQDRIRTRAEAAGVHNYTTNHGYCVSLYLDDPDGHKVVVTYDTEVALDNLAMIEERAAAELERWVAGDRTPNNNLRTYAPDR